MTPEERARLSLDGLSVGDAFGQTFFGDEDDALTRIADRTLPSPPWYITDDSIMAIAVVEILEEYGKIDQQALASRFAAYYARNPRRGYGGTAHQMLQALCRGDDWAKTSAGLFGGAGSYGNGSAMRVAPLGAYFADDMDALRVNALSSAQVTHAHEEGQVGALAVALAAAWAWQSRGAAAAGSEMLRFVSEAIPDSDTRGRLWKALDLPLSYTVTTAARVLGNGTMMSCQDTVPFCLWCAARHLDSFEDAVWAAVSGLGDRDTTCAIVGGIVALRGGPHSIPAQWLHSRESLVEWEGCDEVWGS